MGDRPLNLKMLSHLIKNTPESRVFLSAKNFLRDGLCWLHNWKIENYLDLHIGLELAQPNPSLRGPVIGLEPA